MAAGEDVNQALRSTVEDFFAIPEKERKGYIDDLGDFALSYTGIRVTEVTRVAITGNADEFTYAAESEEGATLLYAKVTEAGSKPSDAKVIYEEVVNLGMGATPRVRKNERALTEEEKRALMLDLSIATSRLVGRSQSLPPKDYKPTFTRTAKDRIDDRMSSRDFEQRTATELAAVEKREPQDREVENSETRRSKKVGNRYIRLVFSQDRGMFRVEVDDLEAKRFYTIDVGPHEQTANEVYREPEQYLGHGTVISF